MRGVQLIAKPELTAPDRFTSWTGVELVYPCPHSLAWRKFVSPGKSHSTFCGFKRMRERSSLEDSPLRMLLRQELCALSLFRKWLWYKKIVHCLNILEMGHTPASFNWPHAMFSFPCLFLHRLLFTYADIDICLPWHPPVGLTRGSPSTASRSSAWNVLTVSFVPFSLCITDVWVNIVDSPDIYHEASP